MASVQSQGSDPFSDNKENRAPLPTGNYDFEMSHEENQNRKQEDNEWAQEEECSQDASHVLQTAKTMFSRGDALSTEEINKIALVMQELHAHALETGVVDNNGIMIFLTLARIQKL